MTMKGHKHTAEARAAIGAANRIRLRGKQNRRTHGHCCGGRHSPTYTSWTAMRTRCQNRNYSNYAYYGGRGIKICARWESFENFLADMGERPEGMTLDRIDPDGDYIPSNCRWATAKEQRHNWSRGIY